MQACFNNVHRGVWLCDKHCVLKSHVQEYVVM